GRRTDPRRAAGPRPGRAAAAAEQGPGAGGRKPGRPTAAGSAGAGCACACHFHQQWRRSSGDRHALGRQPPGGHAMSRPRRAWLMPVSVLLALLLGLLPMPPLLQPLRPYWLALVVAFWVMEEPERAGLGFAFLVGVLGDLAFGGILGEQALRLVVMTFILQRFRAQV